jgi:NAD(P)-dependent dehydrogenase (short-subunit alcohol dehydrogenase family)
MTRWVGNLERVAVITDGNGGIGRGIVLCLAQAGAAVAVLARNEEKNQRVLAAEYSLEHPFRTGRSCLPGF